MPDKPAQLSRIEARDLDPEIIEMLRTHSAQAGWLKGDLDRARTAMCEALAVLKRGRSYEGKKAATELVFQIEGIDRSLAYIRAADEATHADLLARRAEMEARRPGLEGRQP